MSAPLVALTWREPLRYVIERFAAEGLVTAVEIVPSGYVASGQAALLKRRLGELGLPYAFHFVDGSLASADLLENNHFKKLAAFLEGFQPLLVSDHLTASRAAHLDLECNLPVPARAAFVGAYAENVRAWREAIAPGCPALVEHVPAYWGFRDDDISPWACYRRAIEASDSGILLDLHNLYCDERNRGRDAAAFIRSLPPERILEVHVAGGSMLPGGDTWLDSHDAEAPERVFELLAVACAHAAPRLITLEREHRFEDFDRLRADLERIHDVASGPRVSGRSPRGRATSPRAPARHERPRVSGRSPRGRATSPRAPARHERPRAELAALQAGSLRALIDGERGWLDAHLEGAAPGLVEVVARARHAENIRAKLAFYLPRFNQQLQAAGEDLRAAFPDNVTVGEDRDILEGLCRRALAMAEGLEPAGVWAELVKIERARWLAARRRRDDMPALVAEAQALPALDYDARGVFDVGFGSFLRLETTLIDFLGVSGHGVAAARRFGPPRDAFFFRHPTTGELTHLLFTDLRQLAVQLCFA